MLKCMPFAAKHTITRRVEAPQDISYLRVRFSKQKAGVLEEGAGGLPGGMEHVREVPVLRCECVPVRRPVP